MMQQFKGIPRSFASWFSLGSRLDHYNRYLAAESQSDRVEVVLVSPRNPLNIGAVARVMANFGFARLSVVAPYEPHWREAQSAVGAESLLQDARKAGSLAEAVSACTLVVGTGTLTYRKPEQSVVKLQDLAPILRQELDRGGRVALVFGPEKHGLTRENLSHCHFLVEIPTAPIQPSMNLAQAAAVSLYEVAVRALVHEELLHSHDLNEERNSSSALSATAAHLERLQDAVETAMRASGYSESTMQAAERRGLRELLRRLPLTERDTRFLLGLFHRMSGELQRRQPPGQYTKRTEGDSQRR